MSKTQLCVFALRISLVAEKQLEQWWFFKFLFETLGMKKSEQNSMLISNLREVCSSCHSVKLWFPRRFYK